MDNIIHIILDYVSRGLSFILSKISDVSIIKEFPGISSILFTIILILAIRYIWKHGIDKFFDRHFSTKVKSQIIWLISIVGVVAFLLCVYAAIIQFHVGPTINDFIFDEPSYILALMLDPGQIDHLASSNIPHYRFAFFAALVGLLFVTGLTISTFTNIVQRRINSYLNGETRYSTFKGHYVIIGFGELALTIMERLFEKDKKKCRILILSSGNTKEIRQTINTVIPKEYEKYVTIYRGRKDTKEDIDSLKIAKAKKVFLLGEKEEINRDASNIEALHKIVESITGEKKAKETSQNKIEKKPVMVLFDYQTTFAAFQITDISEDWKEVIDFQPFNYYENWAKKLIYIRKYKSTIKTKENSSDEYVEYPSLDRDPITEDSEKHVHLVIFSMSRMGVALGTFAAQVCHFPNFVKKGIKTRITFITPEADTEIDFFRGRYARFFEVAPTFYYDFIDNTKKGPEIAPKYEKMKDMLDIEFEFIRGKAEQPEIRKLLEQWANDDKQVLSIAICQRDPSKNMAIGLYLPDAIYENNIPVFIRQKSSDSLLTQLKSNSDKQSYHRFSHIYPFGMQDNSYDLEDDDITIAQLFNSFYNDIYKKREFTKRELIQTIKENWNNLGTALQWSNLYATYSVKFKLKSLPDKYENLLKCEKNDDETFKPLGSKTELMAQVEHNRWNVEKLLLGYRVYNTEKDGERDTDDKAIKELEAYMKDNKINYANLDCYEKNGIKNKHIEKYNIVKETRKKKKNEEFAHNAIRPYDELDEGNKRYDIFMTGNIPVLLDLFKKIKDKNICDNEIIYHLPD